MSDAIEQRLHSERHGYQRQLWHQFAAPLTISQGSNIFSVSIPVPNSGVPNVPQNGTYSVSGIPSGTYSFVVTFTDTTSYYYNSTPQYTVNGGSPVVADSAVNPAGTVTFSNVAIDNTETLDVDLGTGYAP